MNIKYLKNLTPERCYSLAGGAELAYIADVTPEAFRSYRKGLETLDILQEYARNTVGESEFYTYRIRSGGILHVSYTGADGSLRVAEDPMPRLLTGCFRSRCCRAGESVTRCLRSCRLTIRTATEPTATAWAMRHCWRTEPG